MKQRSFYSLLPWVLVVVQWVLFTLILFHRHEHGKAELAKAPSSAELPTLLTLLPTAVTRTSPSRWSRVAVTLALRGPKWFHRRYMVMLHNAIVNTPDTWAVQLFVHPEWWRDEILSHHRGMQQLLLTNPRVIVTSVPERFYKSKPKHVLMDEWFWSNVVADRILLFSGNGVFCANRLASWGAWDHLDYVGVPWSRYNGVGGDGSTHSLRNRTMMLDLVKHYTSDDRNMAEPQLEVKTLLRLKRENRRTYQLASPNETMLFGGAQSIRVDDITMDEHLGPPTVMSGTQPNLPWSVRDVLLQICPEWKVIFPSLHEPSCFGASPKGETCAASICALQPNRLKRGC